jgi:secretion/DNA translocation related CpaE-like protein
VVGLDDPSGIRWDSLVDSRGRLGSRSLREALPVRDGLAVLTWAAGQPVPVAAEPLREVFSAARRGQELVVVDLPRALDHVVAEVVARCDHVLLVVEPSVAGVASAGRVAGVLRPLNQRLGAVVRDTTTAIPPEEAASVLALPLVAAVPTQRRLAEHVDLGLGPVRSRRSPLARAAREALTRLFDEGVAR